MSLFPCFLPQIVVDSTDNALSVTVTGGTGAGTSTVSIAAGIYYLRGDGAAGDLLAAIDTALESHSTTGTFTCSVSRNIDEASSGCTVTLALSGGPTSWAINTSGTTFDLSWLGMATGMAAALSHSSTQTVRGCWASSEVMSVDDPGWEGRTTVNELDGGSVSPHSFGATSKRRACTIDFLWRRRVAETASLDTPHAALAHLLYGGAFERHDTLLSSGTTLSALSSSTKIGGLWHFSESTCRNLRPARQEPGLDLWTLQMDLVGGEGV